MPGAGAFNPFPVRFGGGTTRVQRTYRAMKNAVGKGGSGSDGSIVELWRLARARAFAAAASCDERAALQAFPDRATDGLPYFERLLLSELDPAIASERERREEARVRWTEDAGGVTDDIEAHLQTIDPRFSVFHEDPTTTTTTQFGRRFQDYAATEPFGGGRIATAFPNYSTEFRFTALLATGGGTPGPADLLSMRRAAAYLANALPAHLSFQVAIGPADGFNLDVDPLDYTMLIP